MSSREVVARERAGDRSNTSSSKVIDILDFRAVAGSDMPNAQHQDQERASGNALLGEILLDSKGRIRAVNPTAERMIGRPANRVRGREVHEVVDNLGLCALIQYALLCAQPVTSRIRWDDGNEKEVQAAVRPVLDRGNGQVTGFLCMLEAALPA
jgi:PAS domain S-box-containing protein